MIIFGWGRGRPKDFGPALPSTCPNCNNQTLFHYFKSTKWFTLFFIPVIPYETRHLLLCPVCTQGSSLTREQADRAKELALQCSSWRSGQLTESEFQGHVSRFRDSFRSIEVGSNGTEQPVLTTTNAAATASPLETTRPNLDGEWRADPSGRHQFRYWDKKASSWTEHVSDRGVMSSDEVLTPPVEGWYPDPELRNDSRYWNGSTWTEHVQNAGVPATDPVVTESS